MASLGLIYPQQIGLTALRQLPHFNFFTSSRRRVITIANFASLSACAMVVVPSVPSMPSLQCLTGAPRAEVTSSVSRYSVISWSFPSARWKT